MSGESPKKGGGLETIFFAWGDIGQGGTIKMRSGPSKSPDTARQWAVKDRV